MNAQLHLIGRNLFSKDAMTIEIKPKSKIDFTKVCRTCLRETEDNDLENDSLFIIGCNGKLARLFEVFEIATGLKITADDKLPRHICNSCLQSVKDSFSFYSQSQRANGILESVLFSLKDDDNPAEEIPFRVEIQEFRAKEETEELILDEMPEDEELPKETQFSQEEVIINFDEYSVDESILSPIEDILQDDEGNENEDDHENDDDNKVMIMEIEPLDEISEQDENSERVAIVRNDNKCFPCDFCQSIFNLQRDLIRHYKDEHTEEKPFKCDVCSLSFAHIQSMRRHKNSHSACPKQKACPLCNWSFSRSDDLRRHMRTHTDERPYACSVCQKAFKQHTELKDHMLSHDDRKMYKCEPCNKEWRSRNGWYLHMKAHQDGENVGRKKRPKKLEYSDAEQTHDKSFGVC